MRRRRDDNADHDLARRPPPADGRHSAYQSDSLARAAYPAYEDYEIHEEFAEFEDEPQPPQARLRPTVVTPAVTLPSVSSMQAPRGHAQPQASSTGRRRTSGSDLSREPIAPEEDEAEDEAEDEDGWLNGTSPAPRRNGARQAQRATGEHADAAAPDPRAASRNHAQIEQWNAVHATGTHRDQPSELDELRAPDARTVATRTSLAPRQQTHHHRLTQGERIAPRAVPAARGRRVTPQIADVVFIPAARHVVPRPIRTVLGRIFGLIGALARRPALASAVVLVMLVLGIVLNVTGATQEVGAFSSGAWRAVAGAMPSTNSALNGPVTAPPNYDAKHFMDKYGFFQPGAAAAISSDEWARLVQMLPAAIRATAAYDKRYNKSIEPQMLLYWTHAEGIRARINYSNCANENTRPGTTYNSDIENCDHASFWQLGYGNQFGVIYVLRNAFTDLYGDPNDGQLVAKVGQWVLDFDKQMGTTPACGGYSCTFPAKTIDAILSGVNLRTGVVVEDNWWASVLSRDPQINSYMIAHALTYFSHDATRNWVGCYYAAPCWQRNSDRLGDILTAWPNLLKAAGIQG